MAELITSISSLKVGDQIIIVAKDYNVALSTDQKTNNRAEADITKENSEMNVLFDTYVQVITIEKGAVDGTFALYTDSGYLYAASSNENHLKTEQELSANSSWSITIDGDGTATLVANGKNARNDLQYNASNKIFSCYTSASQNPLAIYKINTGCKHESTEIHTQSATCDNNGYKSVICADCQAAISTDTFDALGHDILDGICTRCDYAEPYTPPSTQPTESGWTLVTDASQLKAGDKIIIVVNANGSMYAAGAISSDYMSSVPVTDATFKSLPSDVIVLTLGGSEGAWTLTNSGKLLGSKGAKKVAWGSGTTTWTISVDSDGNATISSTNSSYGRFLYNVQSPRFTTYTSDANVGMLLPQIYKYVESAGTETTDEVEIYGASMTVGSTLAMNYYVSGHSSDETYYMVFTMNGKDYRVNTSDDKHKYLVFIFANIPPQMMGDTITAKLYKSGNDTALDEVEISVKGYAEKVIETYPDNEKLINLIADMLKYGAAAQKYVEYKEDELVTDDVDLTGKGSTADPTIDDNHRSMTTAEGTGIDKSVYSFTAAGVRFDFDNKIYVKFKATGDANISLKCNGKYAAKEDLGNGTYIFYTDGIDAYSFDKVYTFELYVDNVPHQTLTYSVNSYAYAKFTDEQTTAVDELALALYRYGLSAKAYTGR